MKILITQLGTLGDMILLTPLFRLIKEAYPGCLLHALSGRRGRFAIENNPHIDKIFIHDKAPAKLLKNVIDIRKTKYDYYIDPKDHYSSESKHLARLVKAKLKIGYGDVFDLHVGAAEDKAGKHFMHSALYPLHYLNIEADDIESLKPELFHNPYSLEHAKEFSKSADKDIIAVNISAGKESCLWQKEKWIQFLKQAKEDTTTFALISAPAEYEQAKEIAAESGALHYVSRNVNDVISFLSFCKAVISVDTAVVHIAAAWNKPLFGLYKKSSYFTDRFLPLSDKFLLVESAEEDAPVSSIEAAKALVEWEKFKESIIEKNG